MVSAGTPADAAAASALSRVVFPERLSTAAGLRHKLESWPESARLRVWKVEDGDRLVGWCEATLEPFAATGGKGECTMYVHPDARRGGIGRELWRRASEHLEAIDARQVIASSRDDAGSRHFCEWCGFAQTSSADQLALDPRTLPAPPAPPPGVELRPCADWVDRPDALYQVDLAAAQDEPTDHDFGGMTLNDWLLWTFDHPSFDAHASLVAVVDGTVVGMSLLYVDREHGDAANGGTGILPAYRNRGLATLLKRHGLARLAAAGVTRVVTENDRTNAPMLAINRTLGYQTSTTSLGWTRTR